MKAKHSPAPWKIADGEIVAHDGEIVGVIYRTEAWCSGEPVRSEDQANAYLIAAAPDLLAALKAIAECAGNLPDDRLTTRTGPNDAAARGLMVVKARALDRAAIAKAKGPVR